jgi:hypothetical protein
MARVSIRLRPCAQCGHRRTLTLVLTCHRNVYTYRWLCASCRDGKRATPRRIARMITELST